MSYVFDSKSHHEVFNDNPKGPAVLMWYFGGFSEHFYQFLSGQKWLNCAPNVCNKWPGRVWERPPYTSLIML